MNRCANRCADIDRRCVRCFPPTARTLRGSCPAKARMIHRSLRGRCTGHHAGCCADIARLAALPSCKGMVSWCLGANRVPKAFTSSPFPLAVNVANRSWTVRGRGRCLALDWTRTVRGLAVAGTLPGHCSGHPPGHGASVVRPGCGHGKLTKGVWLAVCHVPTTFQLRGAL